MKDTRKGREALVVVITAGIGAIVGDMYVKPWLNKTLGVKK